MEMGACIFLCLSLATIGKGEDHRIEEYKQSPGLYYDSQGEAEMYSSEWKLVTYVNVTQLEGNLAVVNTYASLTEDFCRKYQNASWIHLTGCRTTFHGLRNDLNRIYKLKDIMEQLTSRSRSPDKKQVTLMKSTISAVNQSLIDVEGNEKILSEGLRRLENYIDKTTGELIDHTKYIILVLSGNEHVQQLSQAIGELSYQYNAVIDSLINAQKGVLQPQIISPEEIMTMFDKHKADIPKDLTLPFPQSVAYRSKLLKMLELDVFLSNHVLGYVISIPLSNLVRFNVYHVIPLPIKINGTSMKFIFIQPEREYLLLDKSGRYVTKLSREDFADCKLVSANARLCKQTCPLRLVHVLDDCETQLLLSASSISLNCDRRIVSLEKTFWTRLGSREWLFVSPGPEKVTMLCKSDDPYDVTISGTGKLMFNDYCKGYSTGAILQGDINLKDDLKYASVKVSEVEQSILYEKQSLLAFWGASREWGEVRLGHNLRKKRMCRQFSPERVDGRAGFTLYSLHCEQRHSKWEWTQLVRNQARQESPPSTSCTVTWYSLYLIIHKEYFSYILD
ncbi:uncharacterized protein LOC124153285 [Ischnura elegans]|uniref:uncharacterized protein LOC124153285 n=1 Tax=Ischnura elegans TaxID=197161 RepID=UPI001ED88A5E|nr:uncharacterized protein LOC124153285 [Ischnura elegans]